MPTTPSGCGISRFLAGHELQRGRDPLCRHPSFQVLGGVPDLAEYQQRFGDRGLGRAAMAEIRRDRLLEAGFVGRDRRLQPRQPVEPLGERRRRRGPGQLEDSVKGVLQGVLPRAFHGLVHGGSPSGCPGRRLGFCTHSGKSALVARNRAPGPRSTVIKSGKDVSRAFPKRIGVGTYRSHPGAWPGLPSQEASGRDRSAPPGVGQLRSGIGFAKARNGLSRGGAAR